MKCSVFSRFLFFLHPSMPGQGFVIGDMEGQFEDQKQRPRSHHNQHFIRLVRLLDNYTYSFYRHGFVVSENLERIKIKNKTLQTKILNWTSNAIKAYPTHFPQTIILTLNFERLNCSQLYLVKLGNFLPRLKIYLGIT